MALSERRLTTDGLSFRVVEWGDAQARPVLMLHGIRGYSDTFEGLAAAMQPDFRVIAFDQRGRGGTDWDPQRNYYTDTYVADIEAMVDQLALERFDLLGHSMGGNNAIVYAARHPERVRRLVIEDAGPGAFEQSAGAQRIRGELATTPERFDTWDAATEFMRALRPTVTEEARQQRLRNMLKPLSNGGFTWRYDHAGIAATRLNPDRARLPDLEVAVREIRCDTLVLRGGRSDYLQPAMAAHMCELNPRIECIEVPDAGHYIHDDQPALFAREVSRFLREDRP